MPRPKCFFERLFVSSSSRKLLPAAVLSHPEVVGLLEQGAVSGTVSPEQVRRASEAAEIEPRHLKALMVHLSGNGITVTLNAEDHRAVAATSTRKTTTTKAAAKKAPAKKAAEAEAPAKKAPAKKTAAATKTAAKATTTKAAAAKKAPAAKAAASAEAPADGIVGPDGKK